MLGKLGLSREEAQELHTTMSKLAHKARIDPIEAGQDAAEAVADGAEDQTL
jgi:hypothetical protein